MKIRAGLALICIGLLLFAQAFAQMGGRGGGGGGGGGGQRPTPPVIMPNTDRETMILSLPEEWYAATPSSDEHKTDSYLYPTGESPAEWTETLRQEAFFTTAGIETAERVYELRMEANEESCPDFSAKIEDDDPDNGYSAIVWSQVCVLGEEQTMASLHKVVRGNDRLYILSKIWKYDPPGRVWRRWRNYLEDDVYVCDPTKPEHECRPMQLPAGAGGRGGRGGR